jgi:hypothetical protein
MRDYAQDIYTTRNPMNPESMNQLFDKSGNEARRAANWRIGQDATLTATTLGSDFAPIDSKVERKTLFPSGEISVLGGLCSIFTGDLAGDFRNQELATTLVRMDQIVESVGSTIKYDKAVVIEDSFFNRLTGIPLPQLQRQADKATERIARWLNVSSQNPQRLITIRTSDIGVEKALYESVKYFSNFVFNNPDFEKIRYAPVLMMYTSCWPNILNQLGYIKTKNNIVIEPVDHFIDDRSFPSWSLQKAYYNFLDWLKNNPYGKRGSSNESLGIAGFLETYEGQESKRRTRMLPFTEVPNTQNYDQWIRKVQQAVAQFPFPLRNSLIFTEGVNFGYWNGEVIKSLSTLTVQETEYYSIRKSTPKWARSEAWAAQLKKQFEERSKPALKTVADIVSDTLLAVLGD